MLTLIIGIPVCACKVRRALQCPNTTRGVAHLHHCGPFATCVERSSAALQPTPMRSLRSACAAWTDLVRHQAATTDDAQRCMHVTIVQVHRVDCTITLDVARSMHIRFASTCVVAVRYSHTQTRPAIE